MIKSIDFGVADVKIPRNEDVWSAGFASNIPSSYEPFARRAMAISGLPIWIATVTTDRYERHLPDRVAIVRARLDVDYHLFWVEYNHIVDAQRQW